MIKMRRQREDIQVNVAGLRRNIKNLAHNYSDAQVKVREATSNDHWGPSSSLMSEIADLTHNVVAFTEIMQMIWKRLNDSGKNWRHVYKALGLLEYLIKTGSDKVASQCKENIFVIQTLRDFQYMEEGKDQGFNVREKAKALVTLLGDDERLRNERARQLKARERFARSVASSGFGSEGSADVLSPSSPTLTSTLNRESRFNSCDAPSRVELECARPQTAGEEELQLQLALAMSREEAEQEEQKKKSDDVRLQLALSQSENEFKNHLPHGTSNGNSSSGGATSSHMLDLLEVDTLGAVGPSTDPWGTPLPSTQAPALPPVSRPQTDPWSCPAAIPPADPWAPVTNGGPVTIPKPADPWAPVSVSPTPAPVPLASNDPWSLPPNLTTPEDEFAELSNRNKSPIQGGADPFDVSAISDDLRSTTLSNPSSTPLQPVKKTPLSFLGENSALVNLDNLITAPVAPAMPAIQAQKTGPQANPFSSTAGTSVAPQVGTGSVFTQGTAPNLFEAPSQTQRAASINQLRASPFQPTAFTSTAFPSTTSYPTNAFPPTNDPFKPIVPATNAFQSANAFQPAPTAGFQTSLPAPLLPSPPNPFLS